MMLCMFSITLTFADIPTASINVTPLNTGQWPARYQLTLTVPKDHHVYLDAGDENIYIPVTIDPNSKLAASGLKISKLQKPSGLYDSLVKANVLRDKGDFTLELAPSGYKPTSDKATNLELTYQLCNELTNVCLRPQTTHMDLPLPTTAMAASVQDHTQPDESLSFMDKILSLFKRNQDSVIIMFGLMFIAGLLSVATPCVYPMLPIISMFIIGRANGEANNMPWLI